MKTKFFTLFAAFALLFGAKAMAQTDGDVNEDGKVDEQDITAIIQIMQEAGGAVEATKYYWYVGQENPASIDDITKLEGIQQVTDYPSTYEYTPSKRARLYIVIADNKTVTKIEDAVSFATATFSEDTTASIPGYKVYKSGGAVSGKVNIYIN